MNSANWRAVPFQATPTTARKQNMIASVNAGIHMLSLSAMALQARLQANPAMTSVVDTMSGLGASFGLM
ncbi:gp31 [Klebsiella pneumoniae]|uniref:Gp31 n=1 Tax=Klebsiella pneumoniae TaxID=573 RepID=A0A2X3CTB0_KLEPN|nr:gp31 [Klebsiella pneumoniae]